MGDLFATAVPDLGFGCKSLFMSDLYLFASRMWLECFAHAYAKWSFFNIGHVGFSGQTAEGIMKNKKKLLSTPELLPIFRGKCTLLVRG